MSALEGGGPLRHVDEQSPYPGLMPFEEEAAPFFHGRAAEAGDLLRLVRRGVVTVLHGASGLGKTSLLQAGLFPLLRHHDMLPVPLRLDLSDGAEAGAVQVAHALQRAAREAGAELELGGRWPGEEGGATLWELFHRLAVWSHRNHLLTPVLVLDQFEEVFTLGAGSPLTAPWLEELADLAENRIPDRVRRLLDADPAALDFPYDRQGLRLVVALREDFLASLEELVGTMPSLRGNRLRLTAMNGGQAVDAVRRPVPGRVDRATAESIVRFVAGAASAEEGDRGASLERLTVEPALLSVVCHELNGRRLRCGQDTITADLLWESSASILDDFYRRCLDGLPEAVTEFIEERLLTSSGFRNPVALEDALALEGVTEEHLRLLVQRRLLRLEDRFGTLRVELTHDVLTRVVRRSRDRRRRQRRLDETLARNRRLHEEETRRLEREREVQRRRSRRLLAVATVLAGLALVVAGVATWAVTASLTARRALGEAEAQRARALAQSRRAEDLTSFLLFELRDGLVPAGRLDLLESVALKTLEHQDAEPSRMRAVALAVLGDVHALRGDTDTALQRYSESRAVTVELLARAPDDPELRADLALVTGRLGELFQFRGETRRAMAAAEETLAGLQALATDDPEDLAVQRALLHAHIAVGELHQVEGRPVPALQAYAAAREIAELAVGAGPGESVLEEDLALIHQHRGDALRSMDDLDGALSAYGAAEALSVRLKEQDPANTVRWRALVVDHSRVGEILHLQGRIELALQQYDTAAEEARNLVATDPSNADAARVLAYCHQRVGDALADLGRLAAAAQRYARAIATVEALVERQPATRLYRLDLADNLSRRSHVLWRAGTIEAARADWRQAIDELRGLGEAAEILDAQAGSTVLCSLFRRGPIEARDLGLDDVAPAAAWIEAGVRASLAYRSLLAGDVEDAVRRSQSTIALAPEQPWLRITLISALVLSGERDRGDELLARWRCHAATDMLTVGQAVDRDLAALRPPSGT